MTPGDLAILRSASAHVVVDDIESATLSDERTHHVFRVLRVRDGELVTITDGSGRWRECRAAGRELRPDGEVHHEAAPGDPVAVAFAIPKHDRPEWIVQKLTELGVARIVLLHAERSVVRWEGERGDRHLAKARTVSVEALQQSRGVWLPTIDGPTDASAALSGFVVAEPGGRPLAVTDRAIAIGPEGGWTERELDLASDAVSLGETVLRVETAAIAVAVRLLR